MFIGGFLVALEIRLCFGKKQRSMQCYTVYEDTTAANGCPRPTHLSCQRVAVAAKKPLPKLGKGKKAKAW
jgi:hypothetical protein